MAKPAPKVRWTDASPPSWWVAGVPWPYPRPYFRPNGNWPRNSPITQGSAPRWWDSQYAWPPDQDLSSPPATAATWSDPSAPAWWVTTWPYPEPYFYPAGSSWPPTEDIEELTQPTWWRAGIAWPPLIEHNVEPPVAWTAPDAPTWWLPGASWPYPEPYFLPSYLTWPPVEKFTDQEKPGWWAPQVAWPPTQDELTVTTPASVTSLLSEPVEDILSKITGILPDAPNRTNQMTTSEIKAVNASTALSGLLAQLVADPNANPFSGAAPSPAFLNTILPGASFTVEEVEELAEKIRGAAVEGDFGKLNAVASQVAGLVPALQALFQ